jgi:hypothetical protein
MSDTNEEMKMNANETVKESKIKGLGTDVLRRILDNLASPEDRQRSPEFPLGGLVSISGIGHVSVARLRRELDEREAAR